MSKGINHVNSLDLLRGIAILAVLLYHTFLYTFGGEHDGLPWNGWFRSFSVPDAFLCFLPISIGNVGVPIFFVVSGFCIHMSFHQQGQEWKGFFIRRFFRIYPAYFVALIFTALLIFSKHSWLAIQSKMALTQLLTHLFLVHNFHPTTITGISGPFWSLAVEAQLYLLYPALLVVVSKIGWRRAMIALAACEVMIRSFAGVVDTLGTTNTLLGSVSWLLAHSPFGFWFSWALGAYIGDAFIRNQPMPFAGISPYWGLSLAILSYFVKPLFPFGFLLFSVTTAVITCERLRKTGSEVGTPSFPLSILRNIGLWSYSLYLLHMPLLSICSYAFVWFVPAEYCSVPLAFSFLLTTWLMIIPFSILWYRFFELPGVALGKRIIRSMQIRRGGGVDPEVSPRTANISTLKGSHYLMGCALSALVVATFWANAKFTPLEPEERNNLGLAHAKNGQFNEAILQFREAIRVKPGLASAHNNLGNALAMAGQPDEAIGQFREAIRLDQDNVEAHFNLGIAFTRREQFIEAISQFQEAIRLNPDVVDSNNNFCFIVALNNRSWSLATSADAKNRDGKLAVKLAQRACEATHYQKTMMVGTLAAAYAEAGRFAEAISTAQKACALAEKNGEADLLQKNQELLGLYQNHQPYRDHTVDTNK